MCAFFESDIHQSTEKFVRLSKIVQELLLAKGRYPRQYITCMNVILNLKSKHEIKTCINTNINTNKNIFKIN